MTRNYLTSLLGKSESSMVSVLRTGSLLRKYLRLNMTKQNPISPSCQMLVREILEHWRTVWNPAENSYKFTFAQRTPAPMFRS